MKQRTIQRCRALLALALTLAGLLAPHAPAARAAPFDGRRAAFADPAFATLWTRTDDPRVQQNRSWYWGPQPWFDYADDYSQGANGLRTVQYFDKGRLEINNPASERTSPWFVTGGLLVVELVSGQRKRGDASYEVDYREPSDTPVAGNPRAVNPDAPGYAAFARVATNNNGYRDPDRSGQMVTATLNHTGVITTRPELALPETTIAHYENRIGHNIPRVFWDFMHLKGPYIAGNTIRTGRLVDWLSVMGLPISDPYWVRAKVGDREADVLVQLFERRVLTYVPDNPAGYRVEMGNVGQHYFAWRYPQLGAPWSAPDPSLPLLFAGDKQQPGVWQVNQWDAGANAAIPLTSGSTASRASSYRRSYEPSQVRVLIDSTHGDGQHRQIYELDAPSVYGQGQAEPRLRRLTYSDGTPIPPGGPYPGYLPNGPANEYDPSASLDGTKIAYTSDRDGAPQLYLMTADGNNPTRLTMDCRNQHPSWSPDGRVLYWEQQCSAGAARVARGELAYTSGWRLININELPGQVGNSHSPRVSPDGTRIVFTSDRDGNAEIYVMGIDGRNVQRLTDSAGQDEAATWSADGRQLAFASNRDGSYRIYIMGADGSGQQRATNGLGQERWPLWAQ